MIETEVLKSMRKSMENDDIDTIRAFFEERPQMLKEEHKVYGTWLNIAVDCGKKESVEYFLSKGAHIDTGSIEKNPLFAAINWKNSELVSLFLKQDMDLTVKYQVSYGEVDALGYARIWSTPEIVSLIEKRYTELGIPVTEPEQKRPKKMLGRKLSNKKKLDKGVLKEKLAAAIRQAISDACEKTAGDKEEIYAMSFRMHCDAEDADWRYMCEVIVQTKENCIGSMEKKYIPEEYKYSESNMDAFRPVQEYLLENCIDLDECGEVWDADEEEKMRKKIKKQNVQIEKILAETVAELRKKKILVNHVGKEFYVFPYIGEEDIPKDLLSYTKKMNKGLDVAEYNKFIDTMGSVNFCE